MLLRTLQRGDVSALAPAPPGPVSPLARITIVADPGRENARADVSERADSFGLKLGAEGKDESRAQRTASEANATKTPFAKTAIASRARGVEPSVGTLEPATGKSFGISLELSTTARMVGALLRRGADAAENAAIHATEPLHDTPPISPGKLAQSLKTSV